MSNHKINSEEKAAVRANKVVLKLCIALLILALITIAFAVYVA